MKKDLFEIGGNGAMYVLSVTNTREIFEWISLILSIIISVLIIGGKLFRWWKKAKADGKIDKEELDEAIEIVEDGIKDINEKTQKGEKEHDN